ACRHSTSSRTYLDKTSAETGPAHGWSLPQRRSALSHRTPSTTVSRSIHPRSLQEPARTRQRMLFLFLPVSFDCSAQNLDVDPAGAITDGVAAGFHRLDLARDEYAHDAADQTGFEVADGRLGAGNAGAGDTLVDPQGELAGGRVRLFEHDLTDGQVQ